MCQHTSGGCLCLPAQQVYDVQGQGCSSWSSAEKPGTYLDHPMPTSGEDAPKKLMPYHGDVSLHTEQDMSECSPSFQGSHGTIDRKACCVYLGNRQLWLSFHNLTTEMIITRTGRWVLIFYICFTDHNIVHNLGARIWGYYTWPDVQKTLIALFWTDINGDHFHKYFVSLIIGLLV